MPRRRLIVISSAIAILAMGLVALLIVASVTQTSYGRGEVRRLVQQRVDQRMKGKGKLYLGRIGGNFITGLTIDSLEIRDARDSLFLATGPVRVAFDPRDLFDRRVVVRALVVEHPFIHVTQFENGQWNYKRIFGMYDPKPPKAKKGPGVAFGDFVVLDSTAIRRATFLLTMPWHPDDSLRGARRDSAIAFNLARQDHEIRRVAEGFAKTWRWTEGQLLLGRVRLAHPDTAGRRLAIRRLDVVEHDPPLALKQVQGDVRLLGDSAWLDLPHFTLPGSAGRARGKVVWGSNLPVRYAVHVWGDTVSLKDVAWVYSTLPTTGGGRMELEIRNDPTNLRVIDYALSNMDVRSMDSRLVGRMTYGVGGPVLEVKDVDVEAAPVDFRLIRQLNGKDFPYPWAGTIAGRATGPGGPLNHFRVASASFVFRDANVPGATSVGTARGELDILRPAFTAFHALNVNAEKVDLRTFRFLNPEFPPLGGYVTGRATLDSSWLDVRFRDADLRHVDGPAEPSRFTGSGRVTWGEKFLTYDLALNADPVSLTSLARSYPMLKMRGPYRGPLRVRGTTPELDVETTLTGPAGSVQVAGRFDVYEEKSNPDYAMRGTGTFLDLDLDKLFPPDSPTDEDAPHTRLSGRFDADVRGWTLADLAGRLALDLGPSRVDTVPITAAHADLRFAAGDMRVDTLRVRSPMGLFAADGGLGLAPGRRDSLPFVFTADTLGGFRPWLLPETDVTRERRRLGRMDDTLDGSLEVRGVLVGSLAALPPRVAGVPASDSAPVLDVTGTAAGRLLRVGTTRVRALGGDFAFTDVLSRLAGTGRVALDTVDLGTTRLTRAGGRVTLDDPTRGRWDGRVVAAAGATAAAAGTLRRAADTTAIGVDTLAVAVNASRYALEHPATVTLTAQGTAVDSLALRGAPTGWLRVAGALPLEGTVGLSVTGDSLSLADLGTLAQTTAPLRGLASVAVQIDGTRARPVMRLGGGVVGASVGEVRVEGASAAGEYADRRLTGTATLLREGKRALVATASLPLDLALVPVAERLVANDSLRVNVRSDSIDLGLIEAFSPKVTRASGDLFVNVDVLGSWKDPRPLGNVRVARGALLPTDLGVPLRNLFADVGFSGDSILVRRLSVQGGEERGDTASLSGAVRIADLEDPAFHLKLYVRNFHAMARPRVADMWVATDRNGLVLDGTLQSSRLRGGITVTKGDITIPELAVEKKVIQIDDAEFGSVVDTTLNSNKVLFGGSTSSARAQRFVKGLEVENVRIAIGDDVWLRSREANIKLGGEVGMSIARTVSEEDGAARVLPALEGSVTADRGTYRLALGPVQRTFEVEQGSLQFFGDADLNPTLDIRAVHTVRQNNQGSRDDDVRIRVRIGGTLVSPQLAFESADSRNLSTSDLLSYLVTGGPSFEVGQGNEVNTAIGAILPSLGSWLSSKVGGVDVIEVQTAGLGANELGLGATKGGNAASSLLSGTRIGAGKQVTDRAFLGLDLGLCDLGQRLNNSATSDRNALGSLWEQLGLKLDYRLSREWSASLGFEPSTSARLCGQSGTATIIQSPRQFGFDFFRRWEF